MAQSYLRNPSIERLPTILEELHSGALRVPPFQRDFVWREEQRLALCNSIERGLPTGSLMVWRTTRALARDESVGPFRLPAPGASSAIQYLLDGRQRITTLYAALAEAFWTRDGQEAPVPDAEQRKAPDGSAWAIGYDLQKKEFRLLPWGQQALVLAGGTESDATKDGGAVWLPLAVLFDDSAYDSWRHGASLTRELANRARVVRTAFMDYLMPVVPLATDDVETVTLTFKRVNNGGTPMSDADMARALAWTESFDLGVHIKDVREQMRPSRWGDLEDDTLLKVVAAVSKLEPTEFDLEELASEIKRDPAVVELAGKRIVEAAGFLGSRIGILSPGALPYAQILVFAARASHLADGRLTQDQEEKLAAWVAEVCLDERFGGAPAHMIQADWRALTYRVGLEHEERARPRDGKRPLARECWRFSLNWARSKGTALVLAAQGPRTSDNSPVPRPHALVRERSEDVGMLVADGGRGLPAWVIQQLRGRKVHEVALRSPANRVVCAAHDLPALREVIFRADCAPEILRSHLIDEDAHRSLIDQNVAEFFEARRKSILRAEEAWVRERGGQVTLQQEPRRYDQG